MKKPTNIYIKKIIDILNRKKGNDNFSGPLYYSDEEYAQMIYRDVIVPIFKNKDVQHKQ